MAYQIKRFSNKLEDLELLSADEKEKIVISVSFNINDLAQKLRPAYINIVNLQSKAKTVKNEVEKIALMEELGKGIVELYKMIFGEENTKIMVDFFEKDIVDMLSQTLPYVKDVVFPYVQEYTKNKRKQFTKNNKFGLFKR